MAYLTLHLQSLRGASSSVLEKYHRYTPLSIIETLMPKKEWLRKTYHLCGGMLTPTAYFFLKPPTMVWVALTIMTAVLLFEIIRLRVPAFQTWIISTIPIEMKPHETHRLSGQGAMQIGYFIVILILPKETAIVAMCFLAIGDPLASITGTLFGRHQLPYSGKTIEGSLACFFVCLLIAVFCGHLLLGMSLIVLATGVLLATCIEAYSFHIDDNFLIPVASGIAMHIASILA